MQFLFIAWMLTAVPIYAMHLGWYHAPRSYHHLICGLVLLAATGTFWFGVVCTFWSWTTNESVGLKLLTTVVLVVICGPLAMGLGLLFFMLHLAP
jgi:hypothetical protein